MDYPSLPEQLPRLDSIMFVRMKPRHCWQFSLSTLFLAITCVGLGLAVWSRRPKPEPPKVNREQAAIDAMTAEGVFPVNAILGGLDSQGHYVVLELRYDTVTDDTLRYLREFPHLEALYLDGSAVTDAGLIHLKGLSRLEALILYNTEVTDAGLKHLHALPQLKEVYLDRRAITDAGKAELKKALPNLKIVD